MERLAPLLRVSFGLVLLTCGVYGNVIRFLAPLTIEEEIFDEAMTLLKGAMLAAREA